tara:strand:+ start:3068 stop:3421 length:354 start_codon:yes stop_codon:yes gene_type:complete
MAIRIEGADEFKKKLKQLAQKYPDVLDMALEDTAAAIHLEASRLVPVDEGHLKNSINVKGEFLRKSIGTSMEYAVSMEFGTPTGTGPNGGPRPYMRPAFNNNHKRVTDFFIENIKNI